MVDRGAIDRQPDRDIHAGVKDNQLDRDMVLAVILGDDQVKLATIGAVEPEIGPRASMPSARADFDRGAMFVMSSAPNNQPSSQCGFSPAMAMRCAA